MLSLLYRKHNCHGGALTLNTVERERAVVPFYNFIYHRKTDARASDRRICLIEFLCDIRNVRSRDTAAGICYRYCNKAVFRLCRNTYRAACLGIFKGIIKYVYKYLLNSIRVARPRSRTLGNVI